MGRQDGVSVKRGASTLRDAKYREKLKNSVKLLESVLPLPNQPRSRQKLYEDALQLTALLQDSLFHLVNRLRIQNRENIYNFAVFTPSYVQASFVDLVREVESEIKNGTQMNGQLVEKASDLASEFFTDLLKKSCHDVPHDKMAFRDETFGSLYSTNSNSSNIEPSLTCTSHKDMLVQGRTHIADYMEYDGSGGHGLSTPTSTTKLQSYFVHKNEKIASLGKSIITAGAVRIRKHNCSPVHTPPRKQKSRKLHSPKSKKQLFMEEQGQREYGNSLTQSSGIGYDPGAKHDLLPSSVKTSDWRWCLAEGSSGLQDRPDNEHCYRVRVNTSEKKSEKTPESVADRIRIVGKSGTLESSCHGSGCEQSDRIIKTSTRVLLCENSLANITASPCTSGILSRVSVDTSKYKASNDSRLTPITEKKNTNSDFMMGKRFKSTVDEQGNLNFCKNDKKNHQSVDCSLEVSMQKHSSWPLLLNSPLTVLQPNYYFENNTWGRDYKIIKLPRTESSCSEGNMDVPKENCSKEVCRTDKEQGAQTESSSNLPDEKLMQNHIVNEDLVMKELNLEEFSQISQNLQFDNLAIDDEDPDAMERSLSKVDIVMSMGHLSHSKVPFSPPSTSYQHCSTRSSNSESSTIDKLACPADQERTIREGGPFITEAWWPFITPKIRRKVCLQRAPRKLMKPTVRSCTPQCRRNLAKDFAYGNSGETKLLHSPSSPFRESDVFKMDDFTILE